MIYCRCSFRVYTNLMLDEDVFSFLDALGIEGGITDGCIYFGLREVKVTDEFILSHFILETLSQLISKGDLLKSLKDKYNCNYMLDIKFSNIEKAIKENVSFALNEEIDSFLKVTETFYNLNDGYFE